MDSGNLELYALGLLEGAEKNEAEQYIREYPELKAELNLIERSLEDMAVAAAIEPSQSVKERLLRRISGEREPLPLLSRSSDHLEWRRLVDQDMPAGSTEALYSKVLQHTDKVMQVLLVSSTDFEDEVHDDLLESFLILEGRCKCTVGDNEFFMEAGDYTEIPLHNIHRVEVVDKPVVAILQRLPL